MCWKRKARACVPAHHRFSIFAYIDALSNFIDLLMRTSEGNSSFTHRWPTVKLARSLILRAGNQPSPLKIDGCSH